MLNSEQQKIRSNGIGGSEIAAVAGLSPYASPMDVYLKKIGEAPEEEDNSNLLRGTYLGPALTLWYEEVTGRTVSHRGEHEITLVHPEHPLVIATPDGLIHSAGRSSKVVATLEVKAPHFRTAHQWGEPGTDEIPDQYAPQVTWQMAAAQVDTCDVAALIGGELQIYTVRWDEDFFGLLLECAEKFWRDYVLKRVPPPCDGSPSVSEYLARRYPRHESAMITADAKARELMAELRDRRGVLEMAEKRLELTKQELQSIIGTAEGIEADGLGRITWRTCKGRTSTDWETIARKLGANDDLIKEFTRQGNGYRRFCVSFK